MGEDMPILQLDDGNYSYVYGIGKPYVDIFTGTGSFNIVLESASTVWVGQNGKRAGQSTFENKGHSGWGRIAFVGGTGPVSIDLENGFAIDGWGTTHKVTNFHVVAALGQPGSMILGTSTNDRIDLHEFPAAGGTTVVDGRGGVNEATIYWFGPASFKI